MTDFIKLPHWPAFNVADMSITFGVLTLLWVLEGPRAKASRGVVSAETSATAGSSCASPMRPPAPGSTGSSRSRSDRAREPRR